MQWGPVAVQLSCSTSVGLQQRSLMKLCSNIDLLCAVIYPEDEQQRDEVENSKQVLAKADVLAMAGDVVESCKDVNKACRIPAKVKSWNLKEKSTSNCWIKTEISKTRNVTHTPRAQYLL